MQVQIDRGKLIQIYESIKKQIEEMLYQNDDFGNEIINDLLDVLKVDLDDSESDVDVVTNVADTLYGVILNKLETDQLADNFISAMR